MQAKERDYVYKPKHSTSINTSSRYLRFKENDALVYPQFLQFFTNLRYLVRHSPIYQDNIALFCRCCNQGTGLNFGANTIWAYEKGDKITAQYNWLFAIARFLNQDVYEMLTVDLATRDASNGVIHPEVRNKYKPKKIV